MADNAIDKLIEETRAAYTALKAVEQEMVDADRARAAANQRHRDAKKRCDMLDLTMKKHIHENMPVVQAKMIAHEEIEQIQAADEWFSRASSASAQSALASAAINAQLVSITKCYAARNNGSLNLSI
tara:strand:+ start:2763 stop:3143 length:381 start_codon:yes stop_codon:yes gene_type:complete